MRPQLQAAFVEELRLAHEAEALGDAGAWRHLERAHVLSQAHALPHVLVHAHMLAHAWRRRDVREALGQLLRIVVAAPGSWLGKAPLGNTGGANVGLLACVAQTHLPSGTPANINYSVVTFSDGSTFVTCSASTTGLVNGEGTEWYAPWQVGAATQSCQLVSDASGAATAGWWQFTLTSAGTNRATYHDVNTADDGAFYDFKAADCPTSHAPSM